MSCFSHERGGSRGKSTLPKFTSVGRELKGGLSGLPARPPASKDANTACGGGITIMKFLHFLIHICDLDRRNSALELDEKGM